MRFVFAFLLLLPAAALAAPAEFDPARVDVTQGAFCEVPSVESRDAPDTAAGKIDLYASTPEFMWLTARVPAVHGITFGVRTRILDGRILNGAVVTLTHPPFKGTGVTRQSYLTSIGGGGVSINAYTFDLPEELVTGTWRFEVSHQGRTVYTAAFEVVPARAMPEIAGACGGLPLS
ncbi:DUF3859 domain-containing protein [Aestuariicoccus sp. MJ-SS9]|uniref:DUF3859 domain-containing protein n=1 Tax=Aestuariicoccus sp. MJ-SS9 TaxID=3079855 RepID=UPI0029070643|nr:DUF3859 domain-containing protein [Aestuariicoccus sp. MJ-SS9]MDU8911725.1 DUF3859 domain-containing protein [Aestuariicoccus sp. MJ-SS9]